MICRVYSDSLQIIFCEHAHPFCKCGVCDGTDEADEADGAHETDGSI